MHIDENVAVVPTQETTEEDENFYNIRKKFKSSFNELGKMHKSEQYAECLEQILQTFEELALALNLTPFQYDRKENQIMESEVESDAADEDYENEDED